ncbi:hypothetical protein DID77_02155 [Candidatus Marinamargulisbacteria bacterium SCGC AG-439-L15]|nr:hypothetical protein DID77_02155 [Candidatus Marinamargulisbacteria bacterium SCGC AG-439-L15]
MFEKNQVNTRRIRQFAQISLDAGVCISACWIGLYITSSSHSIKVKSFYILLISIISLSTNIALGSYRQLWRYASLRDVQMIGINCAISSFILILLKLFSILNIQFLFILLYISLFFIGTLSIRGYRRFYIQIIGYLKKNPPPKKPSIQKNMLFVGGGQSASKLIQDIQENQPALNICEILDDDSKKIGSELRNIPISGNTSLLEESIQTKKIQTVVICMPSASSNIISGLVKRVRSLNVSVKVVPPLHNLASGEGSLSSFSITLDDLVDGKEFHAPTYKAPLKDKQKRILVTGGAGYIGIHLISILVENGFHVKVLDNFTYGDLAIKKYKNHPQVDLINGDIANIRDVANCVKDVDSIIALAALVGDPACGINAEETLNLNYEATKILIELANFYNVQRIVFASSCSVYGANDKDFLNEESQLNPVSLYAKTRIMSEEVIVDRCGKVKPVILRLSTVFGLSDRMRFDLVVNLLTAKAIVDGKFQIFGGDQWRPFIHCKDVATAFYLAATADQNNLNHTIYNVGANDLNFQLKDIGTFVKEELPDCTYDIISNDDDARNYKVNFDRIQTDLNFTPHYNLKTGIKEMANAIKKDPKLKQYQETAYSNFSSLKKQLE